MSSSCPKPERAELSDQVMILFYSAQFKEKAKQQHIACHERYFFYTPPLIVFDKTGRSAAAAVTATTTSTLARREREGRGKDNNI